MSGDVMAIAPYALLSVAAAVTAVLFALAVGLRLRSRHMLVGTAAMAMLSLWFAGIAITAGPAPIVRRGDAADALRGLAMLAALAWLAWLAAYAVGLIRIERR